MDNRSRTSRYTRPAYSDEQEYISFRSVHNAALQPEYIPEAPKQKPEYRRKPVLVPEEQAKPKSKTFQRVRMLFLVAALTACACCLLVRNAQVYENNKIIQELGQQVQNSTIELNSLKKEIASKTDVVAYLEIAKDQYNMDYPQPNQIFNLEVEPEADDAQELSKIQKSTNIFDKILDWVNSLERRN